MSKPPADPDNKQPNDTDHMTHVYVLKLLSDTDARRIPWSKTVRAEAFMFTFLLVVNISVFYDCR